MTPLTRQAADQARREAEAASRRLREAQSVSADERMTLLLATRAAEARAAEMQLAAEEKEREAVALNEVRLSSYKCCTCVLLSRIAVPDILIGLCFLTLNRPCLQQKDNRFDVI